MYKEWKSEQREQYHFPSPVSPKGIYTTCEKEISTYMWCLKFNLFPLKSGVQAGWSGEEDQHMEASLDLRVNALHTAHTGKLQDPTISPDHVLPLRIGLNDNKSTLILNRCSKHIRRSQVMLPKELEEVSQSYIGMIYPLSIKVDWRMRMLDGKGNAPPAKVSPPNAARGRMDGFCLLDWSVTISILLLPSNHYHQQVEANRAAVWDPDQVHAFSSLRFS